MRNPEDNGSPHGTENAGCSGCGGCGCGSEETIRVGGWVHHSHPADAQAFIGKTSGTNFEGILSTFEALIMELIEKGLKIPDKAMEQLKAGRTLVNILKSGEEDIDSIAKALFCLQNVEMQLLPLAEVGVSKEYADLWQTRLMEAYSVTAPKAVKSKKFIHGIPKGEHFVRIKADELSGVPELDALLQEANLTSVAHEDGYLLIHGKKEDVSAFLKEIRKKVGKLI